MISAEDRTVLAECAARVREIFPEARVWAFGSRARGHAAWDSDFDVCVGLEEGGSHPLGHRMGGGVR